MFESARIKLTLWYVIIAMSVSFAFSFIIYKGIVWEVQEQFFDLEQQFRRGEHGFVGQIGPDPFFAEDLAYVKKNLIVRLLYLNGFVFLFATGAGYLLASKTLEPIEETLEEQKRFITDASHELKTPITALKTTVEVALRNKNLNLKDAKTVLKDSLEETNNLQSLTANLLSLARMQNKDPDFKIDVFETKTAIKDILVKLKPFSDKEKVQIKSRLAACRIEADKSGFEKLATVIIENAIKYSNHTKVEIKSKSKGKYFYLEVKDNGIGIPKKDLPHIFDRFYRVDTSRSKANFDGFGLGLSVAKKIVDQHGGKITVKSSFGKGAKFEIKLPIKSQHKFLS